MASRDGLAEPEAVGNSNTFLWAGQIAVLYGSQLFMASGPFNRELLGIQPQDSKTLSSKPWSGIQFGSCKTSAPRKFPVKSLGEIKVGALGLVHSGPCIGHRDLAMASVLGLLVEIFRNT